MNLQEILGDSYVEGMSIEDINTALQSKNLVDLSTGGYVDINKHNQDMKDMREKLNAKTKELQNISQSANTSKDENDALIKSLQDQITSLNIRNNKNGAIASMSEAVSLLDIKNDDSDYTTFIENVSTLDENISNSISTYFGKQIKNAYEKGKQDAIKDSLGDMGKQKGSSGSKKISSGEFGKQLAQSTTMNTTFDYFKRN